MGFRTGAYAKVWEVEPKSDTMTKARISISRKDKQTGEYTQEFGNYVVFIGSAVAKRAACLKKGDRIKLGDVDVIDKYNKETKKEYINFKCFSFEMADGEQPADSSGAGSGSGYTGDVEPVEDDSHLPF